MRTADLDDLAALMLDAASGAAAPAEQLLAETSAALHPERALTLALADAARDALNALPARLAEDESAGAREIVRVACDMPDALAWRPLAPGVRFLKLGVANARLVRIVGTAGLLTHDHTGEERTLVLAGAYRDGDIIYEPGDMAFASVGDAHAPRALAGQDCICLVAARGRMKFNNPLARIAARLLWD